MSFSTGLTVFIPQTHSPNVQRDTRKLVAQIVRPRNPNSDELAGLALDALEQAIDYFDIHNWPHERAKEEIVLVSGQNAYQLNTEIKRERSLWATDNPTDKNDMSRLKYVPWDDWATSPKTLTGGEPYVYTFENLHDTGQLILYPTPGAGDAGDVLRFYFYRHTKYPSTLSDMVDIPRQFRSVLLWRARYEFWASQPGNEAMKKSSQALNESERLYTRLTATLENVEDESEEEQDGIA